MDKTRLSNVYDCVNRIARQHEARGKDRSNWFYSDADFEKIKKNNSNTIL